MVHGSIMSAFIISGYPFHGGIHLLVVKHLPVADSLSLSFVFFSFGFFDEDREFLSPVFATFASLVARDGIACPVWLQASRLGSPFSRNPVRSVFLK
jgi:hypothetical protein